MTRLEYRVIDTGQNIEAQLNELGADGWKVVGVTTMKQLLIAPHSLRSSRCAKSSWLHARRRPPARACHERRASSQCHTVCGLDALARTESGVRASRPSSVSPR